MTLISAQFIRSQEATNTCLSLCASRVASEISFKGHALLPGEKGRDAEDRKCYVLGDYLYTPDSLLLNSLLLPPQADLRCMQLELEQKLKLNENAIARLQANNKSVLVRLTRVTSLASAYSAATAGLARPIWGYRTWVKDPAEISTSERSRHS